MSKILRLLVTLALGLGYLTEIAYAKSFDEESFSKYFAQHIVLHLMVMEHLSYDFLGRSKLSHSERREESRTNPSASIVERAQLAKNYAEQRQISLTIPKTLMPTFAKIKLGKSHKNPQKELLQTAQKLNLSNVVDIEKPKCNQNPKINHESALTDLSKQTLKLPFGQFICLSFKLYSSTSDREKLLSLLNLHQKKHAHQNEATKALHGLIFLERENYPEALRAFFDLQQSRPSFRAVYNLTQKIYNLRQHAAGEVALKQNL